MVAIYAPARTDNTGQDSSTFPSNLRRLLDAFAAWRLRRTQSAELHALSDAALKDFGISRWEIDSIVAASDRDASGRTR
jgi:uncharacterized protein YjiS (DUF1127 family)